MHVFVIKKIRESKNITIYKLAKMVGISRSYLIEIENNKKTNPSFEILKKIAKALEVDIKDLFYSDLEIEKLKDKLNKQIDILGLNSPEVLETSQIIDLLINIEMDKED